jgi:hypothetical protein
LRNVPKVSSSSKDEAYAIIFVSAELALNNGQDWNSEMRRYSQAAHHVPPIVGIVDGYQPATTKACIDLGMSDVISKPFHADALYESICSLPTDQAGLDRGFVERISTDPARCTGPASCLRDFHEGLVLVLEDSLRPRPKSTQRKEQPPAHQRSSPPKPSESVASLLSSSPQVTVVTPAFFDSTNPLKLPNEEVQPDTWNLAVNRKPSFCDTPCH